MKINYKSDFELTYSLVDNEGNRLPIPDNKWKLVLSVGNPTIGNNRKYVASYDGSAYKNCSVEDNVIHVYADSHCLSCGVLWATFIDYQDNLDFADGDKRIYAPVPTDIELVSGKGDDATEAVIEVIASYILRDAYDIAVAAGYNGTREAYYDALRNLPNDTNAARHQINELIAGKEMIAQALSDRGYPTDATESSAAMAQKITEMAYEAGWLAQVGYSEQNDGGVKDAVAYSKAIKDGWNPSETTRKFTNDRKLVFFPSVDTSQYTNMQSMFDGCYALSSLLPINTSNVTTLVRAFCNATGLIYLPPLDTRKVTSFSDTWMGCSSLSRVEELSFKSTTYPTTSGRTFYSCSSLKYALLKDLGTLSNQVTIYFKDIPSWGADNEENRMSLVHSLRDFSFDRATAEYTTCTIQLHANTLARLTAQEIEDINDKGYTITT